jgi:hypothetical protein
MVTRRIMNYNVFYAVKGKNFNSGQEMPEQNRLKNHITDVTAIIAKELNLDMPEIFLSRHANH